MPAFYSNSGSNGNSSSGTGGMNVPVQVVAGVTHIFVKTTQGANASRTLSDGTNNYVAFGPLLVRTDGGTDEQQAYYCNTPVAGNYTLSLTLNAACSFRGIQWFTVQNGHPLTMQEFAAPIPGGNSSAGGWSNGAMNITNQPGTLFQWGYDFTSALGVLYPNSGDANLTGFATEGNINGSSSLLTSRRITATGNTVPSMTCNTNLDVGTIFGIFVQDGFQALIPNADLVTGAWIPSTGNTLSGVMNETVRNDGDYALLSNTIVSSTFRVGLSAANNPGSNQNNNISYVLAGTGNMNVRLIQDANTTIAQWQHNSLTGSFTEFDQVLSNAQADAISNYGNLSVEFWAY